MDAPANFIGTSGYDYGWFYTRSDVPSFFPAHITKKDALAYYSTKFNLFEVNSSYYRAPTESACKKWFTATPDNFKFLLKFPRSYCQYFKSIDDVFPAFYKAVIHLKHKLLGILLQFSPNFVKKDANIQRLQEAAQVFKAHGIQIYVEFRHASWHELGETYEFFRELEWVLVNVHHAKTGWWPATFTKTHPEKFMARLHGTWKFCFGDYSDTELTRLGKYMADNKGGQNIATFNNVDSYVGQVYIKDANTDAEKSVKFNELKKYGWTDSEILSYFFNLMAGAPHNRDPYVMSPKKGGISELLSHAIKNAQTLKALL